MDNYIIKLEIKITAENMEDAESKTADIIDALYYEYPDDIKLNTIFKL